MYWWGARDLETARQALDWVPAVAPAMLEQVSQSLREDGLRAVFLGPLFGIPYKIFAVHASAAGIDALVFLAITLPARLPRFVLASLLAAGLSRLLASRVSLTGRYALLWGFWIISYGVYFITMSN